MLSASEVDQLKAQAEEPESPTVADVVCEIDDGLFRIFEDYTADERKAGLSYDLTTESKGDTSLILKDAVTGRRFAVEVRRI